MTKIVIYIDGAGMYRWRLVARNGEKVAASEAYTTEYAAKHSANMVKVWASEAVVVSTF